MTVPANPKIYHIVHVDNLPSIVADGYIWSDTVMQQRNPATVIGMGSIKQRRLTLPLTSRPGLNVGACTPFYFCSRSVMLYVIHCANHAQLDYTGGQQPIVHLEADLNAVVQWAEANDRRWAFTLSNAASSYFEDRCDLAHLGEINWQGIRARYWQPVREEKQAEFLIEQAFPWHLVERIGVYSQAQVQPVNNALANTAHRPTIEIKRDWYY